MKKQWALHIYALLVAIVLGVSIVKYLPPERLKIAYAGLIAHIFLGLLLGLTIKARAGLIIGLIICSIWLVLFDASIKMIYSDLLAILWAMGYFMLSALGQLIKKQLSQSQAA